MTRRRPTVAVVGDALLDVHATAAVRVERGSDVPAAIRVEPGGQGANLAVRLARRGTAVRLVCALGDDAAARLLRERLVADGVALEVVSADATGAVVVVVDADGERTMLSHRSPLTPSLDAARLSIAAAGADWLVLSGYVLTEAGAPALLRVAGELPIPRLVVGCAVSEEERDEWLTRLISVAPALIVLNGSEARRLVEGSTEADAGRHLHAVTGATVVVTHAGGSTVATDGYAAGTSATRRDEPIDTTGAGDAFAAALLADVAAAGSMHRDVLERALLAATEAAVAVTRVVGAQGRVPGEMTGRLHR